MRGNERYLLYRVRIYLQKKKKNKKIKKNENFIVNI